MGEVADCHNNIWAKKCVMVSKKQQKEIQGHINHPEKQLVYVFWSVAVAQHHLPPCEEGVCSDFYYPVRNQSQLDSFCNLQVMLGLVM